MTLLAQSEGTKGYAALSWWQTLITGSNRAPLATKHLIQCHITTPLLLRLYSTRWLGNINCYLSAADLLNVNAVPSSPLFPCFSLVAVSSDHSVSPLPGYTVSAASGWHAARTFPEVCQLLFSASRDRHLRIHKVKSSTDMKRFPLSLTCNFPANMSWGSYFTLQRKTLLFETQQARISGECKQESPHRCIFNHPVSSLSVYLTPVDFD